MQLENSSNYTIFMLNQISYDIMNIGLLEGGEGEEGEGVNMLHL